MQTFFLHRYSAHRMFTMSKGWERFFHLMTYLSQGSSYLIPKGYAYLHREHHAFSDTERDPHSPHHHTNVFWMMWETKNRYHGLAQGTILPEERFRGGVPEWPLIDKIGDSWISRIGFGTAYGLFYIAFAPHWAAFLLLPIHFVIGPIHGAIVNWCGHKYGYRNFDCDDKSTNTLPIDFVTMGELFQNNHHRYGMAPCFAVRWFEVDPTWSLIRALNFMRIIKLPEHYQVPRYPEVREGATPEPAAPPAE